MQARSINVYMKSAIQEQNNFIGPLLFWPLFTSMYYTERLLGFQVETLSKLRNDSSAKNQFSSFTPMLWLHFYNISKPGNGCFTGSVSGLSWGQDCCSEGDIGTADILHMEACWREIRNPRKNPSSLLVHPIFHLLKYSSSVFASAEEELNQG